MSRPNARQSGRSRPGWPLSADASTAIGGIALHIEGRALRPEQLRDALERRFSQAERFNDYFLFLDVQRDFVVWHAVPGLSESQASLDTIRRHELMLAGTGAFE